MPLKEYHNNTKLRYSQTYVINATGISNREFVFCIQQITLSSCLLSNLHFFCTLLFFAFHVLFKYQAIRFATATVASIKFPFTVRKYNYIVILKLSQVNTLLPSSIPCDLSKFNKHLCFLPLLIIIYYNDYHTISLNLKGHSQLWDRADLDTSF